MTAAVSSRNTPPSDPRNSGRLQVHGPVVAPRVIQRRNGAEHGGARHRHGDDPGHFLLEDSGGGFGKAGHTTAYRDRAAITIPAEDSRFVAVRTDQLQADGQAIDRTRGDAQCGVTGQRWGRGVDVGLVHRHRIAGLSPKGNAVVGAVGVAIASVAQRLRAPLAWWSAPHWPGEISRLRTPRQRECAQQMRR